MKRLLYAGLVILALAGCKKNETESGYPLQLVVSEDTVTFIGNEPTSLFISTKPAIQCDFEINSYPDWVIVNPTVGEINKDVVEIHLSPRMPTTTPGVYEGKLKIVTNAGIRNVYLHGIIGENLLYTVPDSLNFTVFAQSQELVIRNEGNVAISYSAAASNGFVSLPVTSGNIPVGQQGHILVNANRQGMVTGTYFSKIYLTLNSKTDSVAVSVDAFKEQKTILTTDVIDAEYARTGDLLIYLCFRSSRRGDCRCRT
jgi:hypothetical protein